MMEAICINGNVPLLGAVLSGNTSDKKANNAELTRIASYMKKNGLDCSAYIYVADSAMVTEDNLATFESTDEQGERKLQLFITRLPANYKAEQEAIEAAVDSDQWENLGILAENPDPSHKRKSARYKIAETTVELYGTTYRAVVVHSSSHDKRRTKKLERYLNEHQKPILGWDKKNTTKPTTLMVIFYFQHVSIFKWDAGSRRRLSRPMHEHQRDYLQALGLPESIFVTPVATIQRREKRTKELIEKPNLN